jgi:hypothetical protein
MITTAQAVASLRPGVEWSMDGDDVENITWHTEGVKPLTQKEVQDEITRLEQLEIDREQARVEKLESAKQKLAALGLDIDEVNAVMGIQE